jgi:hypothetical protein
MDRSESVEVGPADLQFIVAGQLSILSKDSANIPALLKLVEAYLKLDNVAKAHEAVAQLHMLASDNPSTTPIATMTAIINSMYSLWKEDKYHKKGSLRLNISAERALVLTNCIALAEATLANLPVAEAAVRQTYQLLLGDLRGCAGRFQPSLDMYSDLITIQATEVDLAACIFRAGAVLMLIGVPGANNAQSIEYLEYLVDEPPVSAGYSTMHVLALLAILYEQSGDHYAVLLEKTYESLQQHYTADIEKGRKPVTNQKKLAEQLTKRAFSRSSEVWEALAVQAVDRCDYVYAILVTRMACDKCPSKGSLHHLLSELLYLTGNLEGCSKAAERSFQINVSQSSYKRLTITLSL